MIKLILTIINVIAIVDMYWFNRIYLRLGILNTTAKEYPWMIVHLLFELIALGFIVWFWIKPTGYTARFGFYAVSFINSALLVRVVYLLVMFWLWPIKGWS